MVKQWFSPVVFAGYTFSLAKKGTYLKTKKWSLKIGGVYLHRLFLVYSMFSKHVASPDLVYLLQCRHLTPALNAWATRA